MLKKVSWFENELKLVHLSLRIFITARISLFKFAGISWIWSFQFSLSSIAKPRYFTNLEEYSLFLLTLTFIVRSRFLLFSLKISSVFSTLSEVLSAFSQLVKFFMSVSIHLLGESYLIFSVVTYFCLKLVSDIIIRISNVFWLIFCSAKSLLN